MCDLFFIAESNVGTYADDTTLYTCEKNLPDVQRKLEFQSLMQFCDDCLKANNGKSHIMLTAN